MYYFEKFQHSIKCPCIGDYIEVTEQQKATTESFRSAYGKNSLNRHALYHICELKTLTLLKKVCNVLIIMCSPIKRIRRLTTLRTQVYF